LCVEGGVLFGGDFSSTIMLPSTHNTCSEKNRIIDVHAGAAPPPHTHTET